MGLRVIVMIEGRESRLEKNLAAKDVVGVDVIAFAPQPTCNGMLLVRR